MDLIYFYFFINLESFYDSVALLEPVVAASVTPRREISIRIKFCPSLKIGYFCKNQMGTILSFLQILVEFVIIFLYNLIFSVLRFVPVLWFHQPFPNLINCYFSIWGALEFSLEVAIFNVGSMDRRMLYVNRMLHEIKEDAPDQNLEVFMDYLPRFDHAEYVHHCGAFLFMTLACLHSYWCYYLILRGGVNHLPMVIYDYWWGHHFCNHFKYHFSQFL